MTAHAAADYPGYWAKLARDCLVWHRPFTQALDESNAPFCKWFADGLLNASYNCLDRHLQTIPNRVAVIFEADDGRVTRITYKELYHRVCELANGLKSLGVAKGDRILIYLPMSIEAIVAMQACARIGAIHSVVFGGFSAKSMNERIADAGAKLVITDRCHFSTASEARFAIDRPPLARDSLRTGVEIPIRRTPEEYPDPRSDDERAGLWPAAGRRSSRCNRTPIQRNIPGRSRTAR
jgi:acetyl-CoA synthetase